MKNYPANRLFSLDLLRGIDMFYLCVVSTILKPLIKLLGGSSKCQNFFCGHPWEGFTLYDLIMPLFIFMAGAAIPLALTKRMSNLNQQHGVWHHVWSRVGLLWVLGMLAQGDLAKLSFHSISPYNNTLQTIAFGYLVAAWVFTFRRQWVRYLIPCVLTVLYAIIVHFGGNYTIHGNVTYSVEMKILNSILPADNVQTANIVKYGYTWFLPSMMFPVITLCGCFSTELLLRRDLDDWHKAKTLAIGGVALLALGWLFKFMGIKMVKHIFTVSFTLQAIGYSILLLALLYVITDIYKLRRGTSLLIMFGQCALTAYLCESVFSGVCRSLADRLFCGIYDFFPASAGPLMHSIGFAVIVCLVVFYRWKSKQKKVAA